MSFYNTNVVARDATNGLVMVGYCDPWDDVGNGSAGSGEGCAIIDNLQVVQLSNLPVITGPTNAVASVGGSATFTVTATTVTGVTNYQWYFNGVAIAGATGRSLTVSPVTTNSVGIYSVTVYDGVYTSWSSSATLALASTSPTITSPAIRSGTNFVFSFTTQIGSAYVVDFKANLTDALWTPLETNNGTGGIIIVTNVVNSARGFYRVRLQ
jgi:hypothetical protein